MTDRNWAEVVDRCAAETQVDWKMDLVRSAPTFEQVLKLGAEDLAALVLFAANERLAIEPPGERVVTGSSTFYKSSELIAWGTAKHHRVSVLLSIVHLLLMRKLRFDEAGLESLVRSFIPQTSARYPYAALVKTVEGHADLVRRSPGVVHAVRELMSAMYDLKACDRLKAILESSDEGQPATLRLEAGEAWTDAAIAEIRAMPAGDADAWARLIAHCAEAKASEPSQRWVKEASTLAAGLGDGFNRALVRWLPLVDKPRTAEAGRGFGLLPEGSLLIADTHMDVLKGLCWAVGASADAETARVVGRLAISAYKKVPGIGPRAVKVGNAAVYALGRIPGPVALGQLAMLKVKVKFIPAQKGIEKALNVAAERAGLPREEIEELGVPTYGMTEVGVLEEPIGDFTARIEVTTPADVSLSFVKPDGKSVKSLPAAAKAAHAEELKDLKSAMKDIAAMLPAQKDRIDGLFLQQKSWSMPTWRERYLDHPLVGILGRRLIWSISDKPDSAGVAVTWLDGALCGVAGVPVRFNDDAAVVRLWHPIGQPVDAVLAWRRFFEDRGLRQPFKQAHREVYLLTDAERRTATYSNRYAAHVLRQHQFHALCGARDWRNKLRLMVDAEYPPPCKRLELWGLRAEFWVEGAGDETTETGSYLHLATDQVRFYGLAAPQASAHAGGGGYATPRYLERPTAATENEPLALDTVPALVFSEIMRDVDLFVGVASVGNNAQWQDGGPGNHYRDYWWSYSFGDLSGTAETRRELLGRLVPRLKIASVCTLEDKFLRVQGKIRAYRIHLGSGNILMTPNDQYLCIVPKSADEQAGGIHLPFDGDRVLSIILSKAFLLAEDDKIKDPSIVSQIGRS